MSGNDQPPVPPQPPGSAPDDEPTPVDPPQSEPGFVMEPPPPGDYAAPPPPSKNKGLIIGVAVAAAIIVIGGIVGAVALIANSGSDDKKDEAKTTSTKDFCAVITKMDESTGTADDPTIVSDALRKAGTPKDMGDDEQKGRDLLIKIGDDAKDGPAAEKAVTELKSDETATVQAFIAYIGKTCTSASPSPTDSPS
jgi:hypothetical protein